MQVLTNYQFILANGTDVNASEILRFKVTSPDGNQSNITTYTVTQEDVNNGSFEYNITLAPYIVKNSNSPTGTNVLNLTTNITATFSETMNSSTLNNATILVENSTGSMVEETDELRNAGFGDDGVYGQTRDKKEIKSEVENTSTTGCFLNAFSCAQIGQSSFNAKANKSIYTKPIFLSFSNLPFFTIFPSSMHSSSVNLLWLSNSSSLASIRSLVSLNFTNSSTPFANSDMSTLNRSGI